MKTKHVLAAAAACVSLLSHAVEATTIHVPDGEPTIQAGINAASSGDTVIVECGTYYEHDISMKSGVRLLSESGLPDCVTVDAQQQSRIFRCTTCDTSTTISGFTLTGGDAPAGSNIAGAIYFEFDSNPRVSDCMIVGNTAGSGGASYCWDNSSPRLTDCTFADNTADTRGGAIHFHGSSAELLRCRFSGNAAQLGGALECYGGSSITITQCVFSDNSADDGGAMHCVNSSSPTLTNCTVVHGAAESGGGIYCQDGSSPQLLNCIVAFSDLGEAVHCAEGGAVTLSCCDVYGNAGGDWIGGLQDQLGVNDNFAADPEFCDAAVGDYTLDAGSPCTEENSPACGLIGALDVACDSPVVTGTWGCIKAMFR